ncbi:hypothetical protein PCNPT3_04900 [Psychromonas sp. CNPT3]|uniref:hypothetical protein n=1 Tax=Psychromonas sp. CNPT3 TaxID=314282 RepID=UPI00006E9E25|nr:hypothetical protein [Psychromonas sp. CNPT3]AGH80922.1 hypothetical protein PCNPT3_04900 [Psychromonas sp. CNPT3]
MGDWEDYFGSSGMEPDFICPWDESGWNDDDSDYVQERNNRIFRYQKFCRDRFSFTKTLISSLRLNDVVTCSFCLKYFSICLSTNNTDSVTEFRFTGEKDMKENILILLLLIKSKEDIHSFGFEEIDGEYVNPNLKSKVTINEAGDRYMKKCFGKETL